MKSDINTLRLKQILNASTAQLAPSTLEKLRTARTRALDHQRAQRTLSVLSWLGHHSSGRESFHISKVKSWSIAVLFVTFLLSGAAYWQNYTTEREINEVDISILTDELPLHVYVD